MPIFTDQMGNRLQIDQPIERVVSLVPSQTELLLDLGLKDKLVGRTRFCIHPSEQVSAIPKIGGTKTADPVKIAALKPDLIIGNKEENEQSNIAELRRIAPVWMSDIKDLTNALEMIRSLGELLKVETKAQAMALKIVNRFNALKQVQSVKPALYFIWHKPWMAAGADTFIDAMLPFAGYKNLLRKSRYPVLSAEEIINLNPATILLSSEPFPFGQKHIDELSNLLPATKIVKVDGECFSWYGSRLLHAADYFEQLSQ